ncbi:hypothetical protein KV097_03070 [Mumia sp. zg.B17]|uniref:hypothetical protein n=1 Tax=Mumia sp. zg.B17 TaxID=2855446 RepID=UPI001C6EB28F|nr:hypothetical protein [Mumia sp. zg.B17]MBW9204913.1 hypothetical protein [Mumia sp. zg.B17]
MAEKQSVLGRVTALAQADVQTLIDDSADPEQLFLALGRAFATTITEAEDALAVAVAAKRLTEHDRAEDRQTADDWGVHAATAAYHAAELRVEGNMSGAAVFDGLARTALERQLTTERAVADAAGVVAALASYVERLREQLDLAKEELAVLEERRNLQIGHLEPEDGRLLDPEIPHVLDPDTELRAFAEKLLREDERQTSTVEQPSYLDGRYTETVAPALRPEVERRLELVRPDEGELVAALAMRASAEAARIADEAERMVAQAQQQAEIEVDQVEVAAEQKVLPEPAPVPEQQAVAEPEPEPEPEPQVAAEPEPEPQVAAEPEPEPEPVDSPVEAEADLELELEDETFIEGEVVAPVELARRRRLAEQSPSSELPTHDDVDLGLGLDGERSVVVESAAQEPAVEPVEAAPVRLESEVDDDAAGLARSAQDEPDVQDLHDETDVRDVHDETHVRDVHDETHVRDEPDEQDLQDEADLRNEGEPNEEDEQDLHDETAARDEQALHSEQGEHDEDEPAGRSAFDDERSRPVGGRRRADVPVRGPDDDLVAPPADHPRRGDALGAAPEGDDHREPPPSPRFSLGLNGTLPPTNPFAGIADVDAAYRLARAQEETQWDMPAIVDEPRPTDPAAPPAGPHAVHGLPAPDEDELPTTEYPAIRFDTFGGPGPGPFAASALAESVNEPPEPREIGRDHDPDIDGRDDRPFVHDLPDNEDDVLARRRARRSRDPRSPRVPTAYDLAYDPTEGPSHPSVNGAAGTLDDSGDAQVFPLRPRGDTPPDQQR